ncbi:MAG: response regulator [Lachnospiraceae bacterium]|nr:response regulator [Lachnospiraceae bacterium]
MKIMIVEDSSVELKRINRLVAEAAPRADIRTFSDSLDALAAFEDGQFLPDVAFLDIEMPSPTGMELARAMCARKANLNVIFTTAYADYLQDAFQMFASGYLLKPFSAEDIKTQLEHLRYPVKSDDCAYFAKTFGVFDFYYKGNPVHFSSARAKELLAYLIDRQGSSVTKKDIFAALFEDSEYNNSKQDLLKKIIRSLKTTLDEIGGGDILIHSRNSYAIDPTLFTCDLYAVLASGGQPDGSMPYMEQYAWAEYRF